MTTPDLLLITSSRTGDVLTLYVSGHLDYDTSDDFTRKTAVELARHPDVRKVVVDCVGLTGVDSMGLSTLLGLRRRTDTAGAALVLARRPLRLNRMLEITGTLDHLTHGDQRSAASADGEDPVGEQRNQAATARATPEAEDPT
ncbi:STAS domain-containing protein [Streptomyces sp. NPDC088785]|uniref:STAS domain-containing protein n=1 Tax=Streptomyces sp. NPDC088785 TaxID=3365897 RepID=UPI003829AF3B